MTPPKSIEYVYIVYDEHRREIAGGDCPQNDVYEIDGLKVTFDKDLPVLTTFILKEGWHYEIWEKP